MKVNRAEMLLHSITRLLSRNADANIRRILAKSHPSEIASVIRQLPDDDGIHVINQIRDTIREPETFVELEGKFIQTYLDNTDDKNHIVKVMQELPDDEVANLLAEVEDETAQEILSLMKKSKKEDVSEILQYGEDTCGRIMAVDIHKFNQKLTAKEAITMIQNSKHVESIYYIYVVDDDEHLVGVISLRQLLQVQGKRVLKDFMVRELVSVNVYESQDKAAEFVEDYNFVSLPVIDDDGALMGMVTVDDVIDYIREEAQDEVLKMAGVEAEAIDDFSYLRAFGSRVLWYGLLFIAGVLCSEIILYYFKDVPYKLTYLCFAPLVLRLCGSMATQGLTFVMQGLFDEDIERSRSIRAFWGQMFITLLVTLLFASVVFCYAFFRFMEPAWTSFGMSVGILVVTVISIFIGVMLPIVFNKLNIDPQTASSRVIHVLMDALSLLIFFGFLFAWS
jgi:magnesium transporter